MKGFYCLMQNKYIAKRRKGKHLTLAERAKIEVYLKEKKTKAYIAEKIGVSERTIYREINRGTVLLKNSDLSEKKSMHMMLDRGGMKKSRGAGRDTLK